MQPLSASTGIIVYYNYVQWTLFITTLFITENLFTTSVKDAQKFRITLILHSLQQQFSLT